MPRTAAWKTALEQLAPLLAHHRVACVLIGSAAAVLGGFAGAPRDVDFLLAPGLPQRARLARVARECGATLTRPYYRLALRYHLATPRWQADFVTAAHGLPAYATLRRRALCCTVAGAPLWVAPPRDVQRSRAVRDALVLGRSAI